MSDSPKAVFLSYAREDTDAAKRIADALRGFGVEVWFDQSELRGGDTWDAKIKKQIRECALFLPLISAQTQERSEGYFRREWLLAVERTRDMAAGRAFVVPVVIDDTPEADAAVPDEFMRYQWTRLPNGEPTPDFVAQVKQLLDTRRKPALKAEQPRPPAFPPGFGSGEGGKNTVAGLAEAGRPGSATPATTKAVPGWLWGVLAVVLIGVAVGVVLLRQSEPAPAAPVVSPSPSSGLPAPSGPPAADQKSIAVLPFANMSEDKDSTFFADGMHEDILTNLALVRDLLVTSRTSVMEYRNTTKKIRQIGAELGVAYVLEGSVRRAGNKVRVTGQLINARTDQHMWAKSYDRDLTDIFAIQSELSQEIAAALSAALTPQEKSLIENRPTTSLVAYDLFLKARAWDQGFDTESSRAQAEQWLLEAVKLDPAFAQAWAVLSSVHASAVSMNEDDTPERLARAKAAIETAVRLAPGDPVVIETQGNYYYHAFHDYAQAAVHYQRLLLLRPNSAVAHAQLGFLERRQGRWAAALAHLQKAVQLDPRSASFSEEVSDTYLALRRYAEAESSIRRAVELAPAALNFAAEAACVAFYARGSTREMDAWLASPKPTPANANQPLFIRREWARLHGDWAQAAEINRQHSYLDPYDDPHWWQDVQAVADLVGHHELSAARPRAKQLIPQLNGLVEKQPTNALLWRGLALLYAFDGDRESALRCAHRMKEVRSESSDAKDGPRFSAAFAQVLAWTGDKDGALAELARLLRTPRGSNVHALRVDAGFLSLHGDPRFEALLNDPENNAPLTIK